MRLKNKIIILIGTGIIFLSCVVGGVKAVSNLKVFDTNYWRQEVVEEKQKRLEVLNKVKGFDIDSKYGVQEVGMLHDGLMYTTMLFNNMDSDPGDLKARDNPVSPGDPIMGDMNVKYSPLFREYGNIIKELGNKYLEMRGVPENKIESVKNNAYTLRTGNPEKDYKTLEKEIRKYSPEIPSEGRISDLKHLAGYRNLTPDEKKEIGVYEQNQKIPFLNLSNSDLDEKVNSAITGIESVLTNAELQKEDFKNADFRTKSSQYVVGGSMGSIVGMILLSFLYTKKKP